jgi:hypothetical protein
LKTRQIHQPRRNLARLLIQKIATLALSVPEAEIMRRMALAQDCRWPA